MITLLLIRRYEQIEGTGEAGEAASTTGKPEAKIMLSHRLSRFAPTMLSVLRIVTALIFLAHGTQKFLSFPAGEMAGSGWALNNPGHFAGIVELVCGILIALGLFTRPAAFLASGTMAVAYWYGHAPQNFFPVNNMGDAAILYCFVFLYFVFAGPGPISVDAMRTRSPAVTPSSPPA